MALLASDIERAILAYYGEDSNIWRRLQTGQATHQEILRALEGAPQVQPIRAADGVHVIGYDWAEPMDADLSVINFIFDNANSNAGSYGYSNNGFHARIPSNWSGSGSTGYTVDAGATIKSTGQTLATIADKASLAITGVNIGAKLGASIDRALYSIAPDWWDANFPTINPDTWPSLISEDSNGQQFVRTLFGINGNGTTAYVDEKIIAQTYQVLRDLGAFDDGSTSASYTGSVSQFPLPAITSLQVSTNTVIPILNDKGRLLYTLSFAGDSPIYTMAFKTSAASQSIYIAAVTRGGIVQTITYPNGDSSSTPYQPVYRTYNNTEFACCRLSYSNILDPSTAININDLGASSSYVKQIGTIVIDGTVSTSGGVDGINPLGQSYPYSPTVITGTTLDEVLQQLRTNYPDLFTDAITETTLQDDGTLTATTYLSVPWAVEQTDAETQPVTRDETEISEQVDDKVIVDIVTQSDPQNPTNDPTDTGTGNGPPIVVPTGNASSLWAVYHPSQSQLDAFGAWLWSSDFVEQIKRLFNDPMQAIIGVHKVFAPIPTGGTQNIKCGYLDSGCPSPIVTSQYTNVDCGTVRCDEYFGNVFDYGPHTRISIYLPFIGVVPLKTSEVMRSSINVSYGVDVITGACLAKVNVSRDGAGGVLYSYGGSCACHYPISSGSYAGIISGIVTSAIGIAGGIATGNPLSAIGGAMAGMHQAHTDVQRSGGFTGCAGAMGPKKPYLIIDRPQTRLANNFAAYDGKPSNSTQFIGDCSGFIRAQEVHFSAPGAFDDEAKEVEALLKSGVLLSD